MLLSDRCQTDLVNLVLRVLSKPESSCPASVFSFAAACWRNLTLFGSELNSAKYSLALLLVAIGP